VQGADFDEVEFFRAVRHSGARALLIDDLITTKRFAARPKDLEDIRLLEVLRAEDEP